MSTAAVPATIPAVCCKTGLVETMHVRSVERFASRRSPGYAVARVLDGCGRAISYCLDRGTSDRGYTRLTDEALATLRRAIPARNGLVKAQQVSL
jgi:hypothetical protein